MHIFMFLLLWLPGLAAAAFEQCLDQFPNHQPPAIEPVESQSLCFESFAILYSGKTKTPIYVVERITAKRLVEARNTPRSGHFYEEARLPERFRSRLRDYRHSGYARGHQAPAGNMPNANAMAQSFSLANVVPQDHDHNNDTWNTIERDTRSYISRAVGDVFVFTGPFFSAQHKTIGDGVWVPDVLWKMVYDFKTEKSWVYWSRNRSDTPVLKPISYQEFVQRTGLNLLSR